jgi:MinD-like ATPase involved in chromosome partitioning or flagellar assembly
MHNLDYLFLDSSSGITQDILLSLSVADVLVLVMRLDEQDYQGVSITLDLAKNLKLKKTLVLVNQVPLSFDLESVETQIRETFNCRVGATLPFSDEYINLASEEIFALKYPEHPLTQKLAELAAQF